jgi:predicted porin
MLLALGGRPLGWWARGLIFVGFAVSLFGAITFGRMWGFYYDGFFPVE